MSDTLPPQISLNVTDIADAVKIIDYAAEQGAFRGWENIRQILTVRDRLDAFIGAANTQVNPQGDSAGNTELNTPAPALTQAAMPENLPNRRVRQERKD